MNSFFVLLAVGKVGHIGTLAGVSWLLIAVPLAMDLLMDFVVEMGYVDKLIIKIRVRAKMRDISKIVNRKDVQNEKR